MPVRVPGIVGVSVPVPFAMRMIVRVPLGVLVVVARRALGPLARKNPWETLHKVLNGQPDSAMPALRALDLKIALDVAAYAQTLPD